LKLTLIAIAKGHLAASGRLHRLLICVFVKSPSDALPLDVVTIIPALLRFIQYSSVLRCLASQRSNSYSGRELCNPHIVYILQRIIDEIGRGHAGAF
jgi:hypothetical protein